MKLHVKKLKESACDLRRATPFSAGLDIAACFEKPDEMIKANSLVNTEENELYTFTAMANDKSDTEHVMLCVPERTIVLIPTGIALEPEDKNTAIFVFPRSGLSKKGIDLSNCVAVIDNDYRGELMIPIRNNSDTPIFISHGERIAQLVIMPVIYADVSYRDTLSETLRAAGGFGSTGLS